MNYALPEYRFFVLLAAGVIGTVMVFPSPAGIPAVLLLAVFAAVMFLLRAFADRGFYYVCAGMPLVIACSMVNLWAGLLVVCMLAGIVCGALGLIESREELIPFFLFCTSSFGIALVIYFSNHVLVPILVVIGLAAVIMAAQSVRMYQFRKQYSGDVKI